LTDSERLDGLDESSDTNGSTKSNELTDSDSLDGVYDSNNWNILTALDGLFRLERLLDLGLGLIRLVRLVRLDDSTDSD
jgi:hypothetical protein